MAEECTIRLRMDRTAALARRAAIGGTVIWAALLPTVPFLVSHLRGSTPAWLLSAGVYAFGSLICHQLPARSFYLWSAQLPVCARCTGIYLGAAIAALGGAAASDTRLKPSRPMQIAALAALPTIATLVFEWTTGVTPANWIRALAGLPLGAWLAWLVIRVN
jgi:uncharacterized membrane protein